MPCNHLTLAVSVAGAIFRLFGAIFPFGAMFSPTFHVIRKLSFLGYAGYMG